MNTKPLTDAPAEESKNLHSILSQMPILSTQWGSRCSPIVGTVIST